MTGKTIFAGALAGAVILALVAAAQPDPSRAYWWHAVADIDDWTPTEVSDGDVDTRTYHRVVTKVEKIVAQRGVLSPRYAVQLAVSNGIRSSCSNDRIVAVRTGDGDPTDTLDEDAAWQIMDNARLAMALDAEVAVVVDRADAIRNANGCRRPTVVRLAVYAASRP